jgi:hypothetical protein
MKSSSWPQGVSVRKRPGAGVLDLCPQFFSNSKVELASNDNGNLFAIDSYLMPIEKPRTANVAQRPEHI